MTDAQGNPIEAGHLYTTYTWKGAKYGWHKAVWITGRPVTYHGSKAIDYTLKDTWEERVRMAGVMPDGTWAKPQTAQAKWGWEILEGVEDGQPSQDVPLPVVQAGQTLT